MFSFRNTMQHVLFKQPHNLGLTIMQVSYYLHQSFVENTRPICVTQAIPFKTQLHFLILINPCNYIFSHFVCVMYLTYIHNDIQLQRHLTLSFQVSFSRLYRLKINSLPECVRRTNMSASKTEKTKRMRMREGWGWRWWVWGRRQSKDLVKHTVRRMP